MLAMLACAMLPSLARAQDPCLLQLCRDECATQFDSFLDSCMACAFGLDPDDANCQSDACQQQFEGCLPAEICPLLHEEMIQGLCYQSNSHAGCIQQKRDDPATCTVCSVACVDECADSGLNDCDANATCMDAQVGFVCACNEGYVGNGSTCEEDADGDGSPASLDCDDADPNRYPGATEVCDGIDNDCNTSVDDGAPDMDNDSVCDSLDRCEGHDDAVDTDSDGTPDGCDTCPLDAAGDSDADGSCDSADLCIGDDATGDADTDGYCLRAGDGSTVDCDDATNGVNPAAAETCNGVDDDCDGTVDSAACVVDAGMMVDPDAGTGDPDAGMTVDPDAGVPPVGDMGTPPVDAGAGVDTGMGSTSGGAGCSLVPTREAPSAALLCMGLALCVGVARRRNR
ncbi:MAG: hypothetical protein H6726_20310 [Sandaracinaceae bacterium]|nr:hypothetical protein [Myxococcales bacterium]MCB9660005.1 hypothetical protein [Sandaracinaceae bacterium]